jgi:hypothetical protein
MNFNITRNWQAICLTQAWLPCPGLSDLSPPLR